MNGSGGLASRFTPEALPVLSALARAYAVCDRSFASAPTETLPNRAFACAATSQGQQLIHDVYEALRDGPGWPQTLLIVTYDEHGGRYDHVPPPSGAVPPDPSAGEFGFDFTRFGVRVPAVLVSQLIEAGTVFRAAAGSTPIDHTSILKTVQERWGLPALTARDAAAPSLGGVVTLAAPRTDDALSGVTVPVSASASPAAALASHLQQVQAELISRQYPAGQHSAADALAAHDSGAAYANYIRNHDALESFLTITRPQQPPAR